MGFVVAMLGLAFSPSDAALANPPTTSCVLHLDSTTVSPGETHTLVGSGFGAHQSVAVTWADGAGRAATTDAGGAFTFKLYISSTLTGDSLRVVATSGQTTCSVDSGVAAASGARRPVQPAQYGFALTGALSIAAIIVGVFVAACGLLFLTVGKRRRSS